MGQVGFSESVLQQISNEDTIYTIQNGSTAFFKLKYSTAAVEEAKKSDCKAKQSRDLIREEKKPHKGDLMIFVNYINPKTADNETLRMMVDK